MTRTGRFMPFLLLVLVAPAAQAQQAGLAAGGGPQAVSGPETITLNVPVQLKEMVAQGARLTCRIYGDDPENAIGEAAKSFEIPNGEFDQVVEVVVGLPHLIGAKSYTCFLLVSPAPSAGYAQSPYQATPPPNAGPNYNVWRMARPDRFFQASVTGPLSGVVVSGPGALQQ